jgi:hypothetical protein
LDIKIDEKGWTERGLVFKRKGSSVPQYHFIIDGRSDVCSTIVSGDNIVLFPERDVSHRALLAALRQDLPEDSAGFGRGGFGVNIG